MGESRSEVIDVVAPDAGGLDFGWSRREGDNAITGGGAELCNALEVVPGSY